MERRVFGVVWIGYFTICMLAFIWPLATLANTVEPTIGGFPFFFAWFVMWVLLIFIGGVAMYIWDARLNRGVEEDE